MAPELFVCCKDVIFHNQEDCVGRNSLPECEAMSHMSAADLSHSARKLAPLLVQDCREDFVSRTPLASRHLLKGSMK